MTKQRSWSLLAALLAAATCAGCAGTTKMGALRARPAENVGKEVTVRARVIDVRDIPLTNRDYYKVTDDSGELWVRTERGVPVAGLRYRITGVFSESDGFISGLIAGEYALTETERTEEAR